MAAPPASTTNTRPASGEHFHALNALIKSNPDHGTTTIGSRPRPSNPRFTNPKHWLYANRAAPACRANTTNCPGEASTVNRNPVNLPTTAVTPPPPTLSKHAVARRPSVQALAGGRAERPSVAADGVDEAPGGPGEVPGVGELQEPVRVHRRLRQRGVQVGQRDVPGDLDDGRRDVEVVGRGGQLGTDTRREPRVRHVERGADPGEAAVPGDQARRGLLAHSRYSGQPVARVAAKGREVGVPACRYPVLRPYGRVVEDLQLGHAPAAVQQPDRLVVVDELEQVPVAGDHLDRPGLPGGQGTEHVVGLVPGGSYGHDAERGEHVEDDRYLWLQTVGYLVPAVGGDAVRLVGGQERDPPGRSPVLVQGADQPVRAPAPDQRGEHVEESPYRVDRGAVGRLGRGLGYPEVGAEVEAGCVDKQQWSRHLVDP